MSTLRTLFVVVVVRNIKQNQNNMWGSVSVYSEQILTSQSIGRQYFFVVKLVSRFVISAYFIVYFNHFICYVNVYVNFPPKNVW